MRQFIVTGDFAWKDIGTWGRLAQWLAEAGASPGTVGAGRQRDVVVASMDGRPVVALGV